MPCMRHAPSQSKAVFGEAMNTYTLWLVRSEGRQKLFEGTFVECIQKARLTAGTKRIEKRINKTTIDDKK